jgi:hypothetical protein
MVGKDTVEFVTRPSGRITALPLPSNVLSSENMHVCVQISPHKHQNYSGAGLTLQTLLYLTSSLKALFRNTATL